MAEGLRGSASLEASLQAPPKDVCLYLIDQNCVARQVSIFHRARCCPAAKRDCDRKKEVITSDMQATIVLSTQYNII